MSSDSARHDLAARLAAVPGSAALVERRDGLWMWAPELDVEAMAREMKALGYRLSTMTGLACEAGETTIIYHYTRPHVAVNIKTVTRGGALPSLASIALPAAWIEREIHDFFAVTFTGHPNLAPLLRPPELQVGFFRDAERESTPPKL